MKWSLDDTKRNRWGIWIDESHDLSLKRYLHEKCFLPYLVCGEDSSRIAIFQQ